MAMIAKPQSRLAAGSLNRGETVTTAIELKPDYAEAYGNRAEILRRTASETSQSERPVLYERALADYEKTIDLGGLGPRGA